MHLDGMQQTHNSYDSSDTDAKTHSKKIRISFENKDTEIYKELIQSLIELSFIKVAELKDELTIEQDVLIYDYFY